MTGRFLGYRIMRPKHHWTVFHVSFLAVLFVTLKADSEESECVFGIEVRRHTTYKVSSGQELRIRCPVTFCNNEPPKVFWWKIEGNLSINIKSKSYIRTEWKMINPFKGESYLIFKHIRNDDAGHYQCESNGSVGHMIRVIVSDSHESSSVLPTINTTQKDNTNCTSALPENAMLYVYCAAGIGSFVIIVIIISIVAMKGCKGKSKKEAESDNQYMSIPMVEQPINHHPSPRGSPCVPPPRRSTRRKSPSSQPNEFRSSRNDEQLTDQIKDDRNRQLRMEESGSVVYAALNHDLPQRSPARQPRPAEEQSEYAAIRVR